MPKVKRPRTHVAGENAEHQVTFRPRNAVREHGAADAASTIRWKNKEIIQLIKPLFVSEQAVKADLFSVGKNRRLLVEMCLELAPHPRLHPREVDLPSVLIALDQIATARKDLVGIGARSFAVSQFHLPSPFRKSTRMRDPGALFSFSLTSKLPYGKPSCPCGS